MPPCQLVVPHCQLVVASVEAVQVVSQYGSLSCGRETCSNVVGSALESAGTLALTVVFTAIAPKGSSDRQYF